jgi:NAD(P)H-hydrate epimerase
MRRADRAAIRGGIPSGELMENAATAVALELVRRWPEGRTVAVLCGPGNNGGDGLAAARLLSARGRSVRVWTLSDPEAYRGDAAENAARARSVGLTLERIDPPLGSAIARAIAETDVVVDALFGTGLARPLSGLAARIVSSVNRSGRPVLSADVPSGLSSDTGDLIGPAIRASGTVAFGAPKMCHVAFPARAECGEIRVADIGISRAVLGRMANRIFLAEASDVRKLCPPRPLDSHKGTFGRLAVIAGSRGKSGAAVLAARGALRAGAGLVTVFCAASLEAEIMSTLPEAMTLPLPEESGAIAGSAAAPALRALAGFDAAVVGPGLSTAPGTVAFLRRLLGARLPLVCDADALNSFAGHPRVFRSRVITPHPGEAARLLACTTREIQADRIAAARRLARRSGATVVLKGAATLVATPAGEITVNPTGTPLMATAGSGDVLAGALGAGLARGLAPAQAAVAAAWLHGAAGERLAARLGDSGLLASELADAIPPARRDLLDRVETGRESVE